MRKSTLSLTVAAFATAAATLVTAPAQAQDAAVRVIYSDLDIATPQGQRALDRRVELAVRRVCLLGSRPLDHDTIECRREARSRARAEMDKIGLRAARLRTDGTKAGLPAA